MYVYMCVCIYIYIYIYIYICGHLESPKYKPSKLISSLTNIKNIAL